MMGETDCGGKLGLVLMGGATLSKFLIQFSLDRQDSVPSLFFDLRPSYGGGSEDNNPRNINNLRYADDATIMGESGELKSFLMKEGSEKAGLQLNIQKTKILASGPITSWQIDGETMEPVRDFIFLGSKITADGDCSHEIKRLLLLGRKTMTYPDSILKSRDITLLAKFHLVKATVFPVVMYGCNSWTIKNAEH